MYKRQVRDLRLAEEFTTETTWLGAHVVPPEYRKDREGYIEVLTSSMLDACAPLAKWADVFCDRGAFSIDEMCIRDRHGSVAAANDSNWPSAATLVHPTPRDEKRTVSLFGVSTFATSLSPRSATSTPQAVRSA